MFWKIGFFVAVAGLIAALYWGSNMSNLKCPPCAELCSDFPPMMLDQIAESRISMYYRFLSKIDLKVKKGTGSDTIQAPAREVVHVDTIAGYYGDFQYFHIDHCEFSSVIKTLGPQANVYAFLGVTPANQTIDQPLDMDLVFYVVPGTAADRKALNLPPDGDGAYFDLNTPCPPVCNDPPAVLAKLKSL